jgi:hypothetical protein
MYKLYTDKPETFECDIKIEGSSLAKSKVRLVVETKDYSLMFNGKIDNNGKCKVPIKKLKGLIDENVKGNIRLEVIADDTYFTPWKSDFSIEASKSVTVEVKSQTEKSSLNDSVKVKNVKQITEQETNHVVNLLKLLIRENINIENLSVKKDRVNKIIATYEKHMPITENKKHSVMLGLLNKLPKK